MLLAYLLERGSTDHVMEKICLFFLFDLKNIYFFGFHYIWNLMLSIFSVCPKFMLACSEDLQFTEDC